jgi:hypothetical protein
MNIAMARQLASFVGALLILIAYTGSQLGWMNARRAGYNILNAVGSAILAYIAFHPFQIGFVILEVVWALISIYALLRTGPAPKSEPR